jgi:hypothetical protein
VTDIRPQHCIPLALALLLAACGGGGGASTPVSAPEPAPEVASDCSSPCALTLSWTANREAGVNAAGGGYHVYYATSPNVALGQATQVTVAYDPGLGLTPTSTALQLAAGTWYLRVVAFSALNPAGSAPSAELSLVVAP